MPWVSTSSAMKKYSQLKQEDFDSLLTWLSSEREEAGRKYEEIRAGLIRFFRFRGCTDTAALADETINRVAAKVSMFDFDRQAKTISFFYGFASKIYLEYLTREKKREAEFESSLLPGAFQPATIEDPDETLHDCLEKCLRSLEREENELVVAYYSREKSDRMAFRRELAELMNLNAGALHTRIYRIRNALKLCIETCLQEKDR